GLSGEPPVSEFHHLAVDRSRGPDLDPKRLRILPARRPDVDEHVIGLHPLLPLLLVHLVRGFSPENTRYFTACAMEDHTLVVEGRSIPSPEGDKPDESLVIDGLDHQPNLIRVGRDHHLEIIPFLY